MSQSKRKSCRRKTSALFIDDKSRRRRPLDALLVSVFVLLFCCGWSGAAPSTGTGTPPQNSDDVCTTVAHLFEAKGLPISANEMPKQPVLGKPSKICEAPKTGTCCSWPMESKLAESSRAFLDKQTKDSIGKLASVLGNRAQKFNDYFKELLAESKKDFHGMFKKTYGAIYEQNSYVFSDLFTELETYYSRGKVDLIEAMDQFFNILYQKMFIVLNSQFTFDEKYLSCVSEHMKQLKPFGDVPDKLSVQIKRSFVATRTYAQSLGAAADVVRNMMNIKMNPDCIMAATKMQNCGICVGKADKPCPNYCVNVMKGCLQNFVDLDHEWDNFVASVEKVSDRLLGPFNVVMVVEPINIKISEAIMNFQETNRDISSQVFQGCGRPMLGKQKRSLPDNDFTFTDEMEDTARERIRRDADPGAVSSKELNKFEPLRFSNGGTSDSFEKATGKPEGGQKGNKGKNKNRNKSRDYDDDDYNKEPMLDKLIKEIRQKMKETKKFWSNLPFQVCNNEELSTSPNDQSCWNGNAVATYSHGVAVDMKSNPEFQNVIMKRSAILEAQLYTLRTSTNQLRNAYNGLDVEWSDQEEVEYGSGSGSGIDLEEDDDDDEGSGLGSFDYDPNIGGRTNGDLEPEATKNTSTITSSDLEDLSKHQHTINTSDSDVARPEDDEDDGGEDGEEEEVAVEENEVPTGGEEEEKKDSSSNSRGGPSSTTGGGASAQEMSILRALITYFFPIFMAWFGGIFSILL